MNTKRLILSPQDRGGIGKSFVATLLYDYFVDAKVKIKTLDLDHANSTFKRLVPEAEFIHTDVDTHRLAVLDRLVSALQTVDTVLVDNRATGGSKLLEYVEDSRLTDLKKTLEFDLVFVIIAVDDRDAISQAADVLDQYGKGVRWLIAKNYRDSTELPLFDASDTRKRLQETAWHLGFLAHEIPMLTAAGLLKPLGKPSENGSKFFSTFELDQLKQDSAWLARACDVVVKYWKDRNLQRPTQNAKARWPQKRLGGAIHKGQSPKPLASRPLRPIKR
jgi:hypothetical protein